MSPYIVYDTNNSDVVYEAESLEEAQNWIQNWLETEMGYVIRNLVIYKLEEA